MSGDRHRRCGDMAVQMRMLWKGVTPEQYDEVRRVVRWEEDTPDGAIFHVASFDDKGAHITDVWASADAFNDFVETRLNAGVAQVGLEGQPEVEILPAHAVFIP
jgi:hypothetical protein